MKYNTTKRERDIIDMLDLEKMDEYINSGDIWKVFRATINATKKYYKVNKK